MGKKLFGLGKRLKKGVKPAEDLYTAEDDFGKFITFGKKRLKKSLFKSWY